MRPIDADKLIQFVDYSADLGGLWGRMLTAFKTVIKEVVNIQPTIEPERTGHWIEFPNHNAYKCSECGRIIGTADGKNNVYKHYPYCHCGARMEGEEHD